MPKKTKAQTSPLSGASVVLVGTLRVSSRRDVETRLASAGAEIAKSITKKTNFVIAGDNPGGGKLRKAVEMGVRIEDEDWMNAVLLGADPEGSARIDAGVAKLGADGLRQWLEGARLDGLYAPRDLPPIASALYALEQREGVTPLHRAISEKILAKVPHRLAHGRHHFSRITGYALSPCGAFMATVSNPPYGIVETGGEKAVGALCIWELASGRVINRVDLPGGGATRGEPSFVQWSGDGRSVFVPVNGCGVGRFSPFGTRGGPLMQAAIGGSWDPTPFAISPGADRLCLSRNDGESPLALVPATEDRWIGEASAEIEWLAPRGARTTQRLRWFDGDWIAASAGYAVEVGSRELLWDRTADAGEAIFNSDGRRYVSTSGCFLGDGRTGATVLALEEDFQQVLWSSSEPLRFALVSRDDVHIYEDSERRLSLRVPVLFDKKELSDSSPVAFDPSGARVAILTRSNTIQLHALGDGKLLAEIGPLAGGVSAIAWGGSSEHPDRASSIIVAVGPDLVEFWTLEGACTGRHVFGVPPGFVEPVYPASWGAFYRQVCLLPSSDTLAWRPIVTSDEGARAFCDPRDAASLDELLVITAGGAVGWPWRWVEGTSVAAVVHDLKAAKALQDRDLELRIKTALARTARPQFREDATYGFSIQRLGQDDAERVGIEEVRVPDKPIHMYRAPTPLRGDEIERAHESLKGKVVLFAERHDPRARQLGTFYGIDGSRVAVKGPLDGSLVWKPLDSIEWLGAAWCCGSP
jgi:BRCA1 C Terminus (BRCT) domain